MCAHQKLNARKNNVEITYGQKLKLRPMTIFFNG